MTSDSSVTLEQGQPFARSYSCVEVGLILLDRKRFYARQLQPVIRSQDVTFISPKGPFKNDVIGPGGGGSDELVTKSDKKNPPKITKKTFKVHLKLSMSELSDGTYLRLIMKTFLFCVLLCCVVFLINCYHDDCLTLKCPISFSSRFSVKKVRHYLPW